MASRKTTKKSKKMKKAKKLEATKPLVSLGGHANSPNV